jgi:maltooligosyltrehalose trehalohydrolase
MPDEPEHKPQGALRQCDGTVLWRLWAPFSVDPSLVLYLPEGRKEAAMTPQGFGYFTHQRPAGQTVKDLRYAFKLGESQEFPDPTSRWQPEGVNRPSALFFPDSYQWTDQSWHGIPPEDLAIYELHVGTFTPEGTFDAIIPRLEQLSGLGVTALEIMPLAQFSGERNWGYDGVHPYAVQNSYGGPQALQRLVDTAHRIGLGVILDVVYNHIGPEGNYFGKFGPYFTDRYHTPWGKAINYDGAECDAVRQFVVDNACFWVRDFHVDGLRLDAVQTIYDFSARHILADIKAAVKQVADSQGRIVHVIAETNQNDVRLINPPEQGGYDLDGVWADDFHHSVHAILTGQRDGYYEDFGRAQDLVKALNGVFVYDGCYSRFRKCRCGSRVDRQERTRFVVCVQNHDQVGNRARGDRLGTILPRAAQRLACGLLMLSPCVPLLFMGEEYGEQRPFPFFCSFSDPRLIEAVRRGRREEFAYLRFNWNVEIPEPQSPDTFFKAKLQWSWPEGSDRAKHRRLYQDLLAARRQWPALRDRLRTKARLMDSDPAADPGRPVVLLLERGGPEGLLAAVNLSDQEAALTPAAIAGRHIMLSTEDLCYGGIRLDQRSLDRLLPFELLIFGRS